VAKITINGEVFEYDLDRKPLSEALALEAAMKKTEMKEDFPNYAAWEAGLHAGSARAVAGFVWLVWRRNGRDVPLADLLSGAIDVELAGFGIDDGDAEAGPTTPTPYLSPMTGSNISGRSRKSSASAPGK